MSEILKALGAVPTSPIISNLLDRRDATDANADSLRRCTAPRTDRHPKPLEALPRFAENVKFVKPLRLN
ncbi:MAG: hypothetical protein Q4E13_06320 [Clostridia bacterium]|nr:hypothetical protein [Clostridia bacterium]